MNGLSFFLSVLSFFCVYFFSFVVAGVGWTSELRLHPSSIQSTITERLGSGMTDAHEKIDQPKILWVDSYRNGYEWSDGIEQGIRSVLERSDALFRIHRMGTKACQSVACMERAAEAAFETIRTWQPDVVIASDDNAQKYLVLPYLKGGTLPVVFCGVNWDASVYGYPTSQITGMVEVESINEAFSHLSRFADGERVGWIGNDTPSSRKNARWLQKHIFKGALSIHHVKRFSEFKARFLALQQEVDMIFLHSNAAIEGWSDLEAGKFIVENIGVPIMTTSRWMAKYALIAMVTLPEEQGQFAARAAVKIAHGMQPSDIPVAVNKDGKLTVNLEMAQALGVTFPLSMLGAAKVIGQEAIELKRRMEELPIRNFTGKRIVWVDSYHNGFPWSDAIERGIREVLYGTGATLDIIRLNSKREKRSEEIQQASMAAKSAIDQIRPDVLIASDDNAQRYLVVPHYIDGDLSVVFCGVNENARAYGYPTRNITGMIEKSHIVELVAALETYAQGNRIGYLAGNTTTERKVARWLAENRFKGRLYTCLVEDMETFVQRYIELQDEVDMILFITHAGIKGWDGDAAKRIVEAHTRIPSGGVDSYMEKWNLLILAKSGEEQGRHAALTAFEILAGTPIESIPVVTNSKKEFVVNLALAEKLNIRFPLSILKQARVIR